MIKLLKNDAHLFPFKGIKVILKKIIFLNILALN